MSSTTGVKRKRSQMFSHQEALATKFSSAGEQAAFVKMGLGKTAGTLTALVDLAQVEQLDRVLVLAPSMVVEADVWGREAKAWEHLEGVYRAGIVGSPDRRLDLLKWKAPYEGLRLDVISYENATWLCELMDFDLADIYDGIIFDELSKLKTPGSQRFRRLRHWAKELPFRFGLTGSPVGNNLLDLWGEMYMIAGEKPLGRTYTDFRSEYFRPRPVSEKVMAWDPIDGAKEAITERIKPYAFSFDQKLADGILPRVQVNPIELVLPPKVRDIEAKLANECVAMLESGITLEALNASVKAMKCRQLASGAVYVALQDDTQFPLTRLVVGTDERMHWEEVHTEKIKALEEVLDEQQGDPLIVFYWFRHELERIKKRFPFAREVDGRSIDAWNAGKVKLLLAHPQSAGHGINLQEGGSSVCWFSLPHSHELWEQGNGRIARPGQRAPFVTASVLLCGEFDHAMLSLLREKGETQAYVVNGVRL